MAISKIEGQREILSLESVIVNRCIFFLFNEGQVHFEARVKHV